MFVGSESHARRTPRVRHTAALLATTTSSMEDLRLETKRTRSACSTSSSDSDSDSPPPKKIKHERLHTIAHKQLGNLNTQHDFWYPDGNVVLVVDGSIFKLYKARLARYSSVLDTIFNAGTDDEIDDLPAYTLPNISCPDFVTFLQALETPFKTATQLHATAALLIVSEKLKCTDAARLALHQLREIWPANRTKLAVGAACHYPDVLRVIQISREHDQFAFRTHAFYELIRSPAFWDAVGGGGAADRTALGLADGDLVSLLCLRVQLRQAWSALVLAPPYPDAGSCRLGTGRGSCRKRFNQSNLRKAFWLESMLEDGLYHAGMQDPLGNLELLLEHKKDSLLADGWCKGCIGEREDAWAKAQKDWWVLLDNGLPLR
ncbi:hypothetical protein BC628DRAFT_855251 [Trametes gibbosa]|nr:hypothetical protein BC628DRAFT_855251 [Trametes gibbosa]